MAKLFECHHRLEDGELAAQSLDSSDSKKALSSSAAMPQRFWTDEIMGQVGWDVPPQSFIVERLVQSLLDPISTFPKARSCVFLGCASFAPSAHLCTVQCDRPSTQITVKLPSVLRRALWQLVRLEELAHDLSRRLMKHYLCRKR